MFTRRGVNKRDSDHGLLLCILILPAAVPSPPPAPPPFPLVLREPVTPFSAPNFPHRIQSRPGDGQLHYCQYLKITSCVLAGRSQPALL